VSGGLWRDNPATKSQQRLVLAPLASAPRGKPRRATPGRVTQADILKAMLRERREHGTALELYEILRTGIAQFTARIFELRQRGFVIDNELGRDLDGRVLSRYWLRFDPEREEQP
jgi:hypothetical protein